jgi:tetratricopeptide (TPR) repeat protein
MRVGSSGEGEDPARRSPIFFTLGFIVALTCALATDARAQGRSPQESGQAPASGQPRGTGPARGADQDRREGKPSQPRLIEPAQRPREPPGPSSQPSAQPSPTIHPAERAFVEGRFEEIDALAAAQNPPAPVLVAKARADAARGRYDAAVTALTQLSAAQSGGEATLELGVLQAHLGRKDEAMAAWQAVIDAPRTPQDPLGLVRVARAAAALGQPRAASRLFQEATTLSPADPRAHTAWGELFLGKHDPAVAAESFRDALKSDEGWVPAFIGLARTLADSDTAQARAILQQALTRNPASVDARLLLAELALDERNFEDAASEIDRALAVNPSSLDALSLRAAVSMVADRTAEMDSLAARVLAINPRYGTLYRVIGAHAASHYRFEEAVAFLKKAVELDADDPRSQAELGMHLLRTGDEPAARAALERAFKLDSYDLVTYNLLNMLDRLDKFQTFTEGELVVRVPADEAPIMREAVTRLARQGLDALGKRYALTPRGPILIEMFQRHDDFAVRTLGLPGMEGALGACFGRVVTLDSPKARPPGAFNWSATLWHELAHVITLQLSAQRVPRWLTEGASVFEERRASPSWGREGEHEFLKAYARGDLLKVDSLNAGFSSGRTINLAYHQSSLVVEHLVERFGDAGLQRLLKAFGEGKSQAEALSTALGLTFDALQASFDEFLSQRFGQARLALAPLEDPFPSGKSQAASAQPSPGQASPGQASPGQANTDANKPDADAAAIKAYAEKHRGNYGAQVQAGQWLFERGDLDGARDVLERGVALVPQTMGDESPRTGLAEIAVKQGDQSRALRELETVLSESHTGLAAARRLRELAREAADVPRLRLAAERIVALDPFDSAGHAELGRLALDEQDLSRALREFEAALALGPADVVASHADLAEVHLAAGHTAEARRHAIAALELAPRFERAQELLLRVVDGR